MNFSRFVQLKNGPKFSDEETIKYLYEVCKNVMHQRDVFDSYGDKNGFTQVEGNNAPDQKQYINNKADGDNEALYLACKI